MFLSVYDLVLRNPGNLADPESGIQEGWQGKTMDWDALNGSKLGKLI